MKQFLTGISVLIFLCGVLCYSIKAQTKEVDAGYRGSTYLFEKYRPKGVSKLSEIPQPARSNIVAHLRKRLGEHFYSKLRFELAEVIDLEELYRVEPNWKKEKVGSFVLHFHFSDKKHGLKFFYTRMAFDATGEVVNDIDLPEISAEPGKANLISAKEAMKIASKNDFAGKSIRPDFDYLKEFDSFVWVIIDGSEGTQAEKCRSISGAKTDAIDVNALIGHGPYRRLFIEAHTGRILKEDCYNYLF